MSSVLDEKQTARLIELLQSSLTARLEISDLFVFRELNLKDLRAAVHRVLRMHRRDGL